MNIFVVCRQNQARSITIAALLRRNFPAISAYSAGVEVSTNSEIPASIRALCQSWGLEIPELVSTPWDSISEKVEPDDIVICADDHVFERVKLGVGTSHIINLANSESPDFLIPTDPAGATRAVVEQELAKCLVQAIRFLAPHMKWASPMITEIYVPRSEEEIPEAIMRARKEHPVSEKRGMIFLDCNLRAPNSSLWNPSENIRNFDESLTVQDLQSGDVVQASHEFTSCPQILLSHKWRTFISELGQSFQVVALAPPLYINGLISTESLFTLLCADKPTII
jgi:protein-tyrosine-phosphatase